MKQTYQAIYARLRREQQTPEERAEANRKQREKAREKRANETEEEREVRLAKQREYNRRFREKRQNAGR